ncbi:MAG: SsrA-binding protein SmpB [Lentisphaeria bacterium]
MVKMGSADLALNKKAFHNYEIIEKYEAGIELKGTEVKSCRGKHIQMGDSYARFINFEIFLQNINIAPYSHGNLFNHEPLRERRLLMHKQEIRRLKVAVEAKGLTLIPLKFYLKNGKVKVQLGLCRGKNVADKRETLKERAANLESMRAMKNY